MAQRIINRSNIRKRYLIYELPTEDGYTYAIADSWWSGNIMGQYHHPTNPAAAFRLAATVLRRVFNWGEYKYERLF